MAAAEGGLSLEMHPAIDVCAHGVACGLETVAERDAAMLLAVQDERVTMLRAVQEERTAALHALAERETETSAGRETLAVDRAALDTEISAMEVTRGAAAESRVQLDVEGAVFTTSRATLTVIHG